MTKLSGILGWESREGIGEAWQATLKAHGEQDGKLILSPLEGGLMGAGNGIRDFPPCHSFPACNGGGLHDVGFPAYSVGLAMSS